MVNLVNIPRALDNKIDPETTYDRFVNILSLLILIPAIPAFVFALRAGVGLFGLGAKASQRTIKVATKKVSGK